MRSIVLHYHIFKNAGTTIDAILQENFPDACGAVEGESLSSRMSPQELLQYLVENPALKAVSSHQAVPPPPVHPAFRFFPILFVRHPLDRVGSAYSFDRRQAAVISHPVQLAKRTDLRGYVQTLLSNEARVSISNFQCAWLAGRVSDFHDTDALHLDFELAKKRLADLEFFGLVDEFDRSLELLQAYLQDAFGPLKLEHTVENKSDDRRGTLPERLEDIRTQLGPSLYRELTEKNALDLALYEIANREFRRRYSLLQVRRFAATALPKGSAPGRLARALNWKRLELQLSIRRLCMDFSRARTVRASQGLVAALSAVLRRLRGAREPARRALDVVRAHPRTFPPSSGRALTNAQADSALMKAAASALLKLLRQLKLPYDPAVLLPRLAQSIGKSQFLETMEHFLIYSEFAATSGRATGFPVLRAADLAEPNGNPRRRRILFVCGLFPSPHHGGGNRVSNFIKLLSEQNDVLLCTAFSPGHDAASLAELDPYCSSVLQLPAWSFGQNQQVIKNWLEATPVDVVHYEWPESLQNYDPQYGPLQIFTYMEAVSLRLRYDLDRIEPLSDAWLFKFEDLLRILRLEVVDASRLQARIAVTTKDAEFFKGLYPAQQYAVLNHGITLEDFSLPDLDPEPNTLVYVGNFVHYPNHDAMNFFFRQIWPEIVRQVPDARIYVVGAGPTPELLARADDRQVFVTGRVEDIRPYIQKAVIGIAPLITGAGLRGKVMEYAALRRTFVATSIATEDLAFEDGVHYLHAEAPADFAGSVVALLQDRRKARAMGVAAFEVVRDKYDNRRLVGYLNALYDFLEGRGQA